MTKIKQVRLNTKLGRTDSNIKKQGLANSSNRYIKIGIRTSKAEILRITETQQKIAVIHTKIDILMRKVVIHNKTGPRTVNLDSRNRTGITHMRKVVIHNRTGPHMVKVDNHNRTCITHTRKVDTHSITGTRMNTSRSDTHNKTEILTITARIQMGHKSVRPK